jgi:hypothetical protein
MSCWHLSGQQLYETRKGKVGQKGQKLNLVNDLPFPAACYTTAQST